MFVEEVEGKQMSMELQPREGMMAIVRKRRAMITGVQPYDAGEHGRFHLVEVDYASFGPFYTGRGRRARVDAGRRPRGPFEVGEACSRARPGRPCSRRRPPDYQSSRLRTSRLRTTASVDSSTTTVRGPTTSNRPAARLDALGAG